MKSYSLSSISLYLTGSRVEGSFIATNPGKKIRQGHFIAGASVFNKNLFYASLISVSVDVFQCDFYASVINVTSLKDTTITVQDSNFQFETNSSTVAHYSHDSELVFDNVCNVSLTLIVSIDTCKEV